MLRWRLDIKEMLLKKSFAKTKILVTKEQYVFIKQT